LKFYFILNKKIDDLLTRKTVNAFGGAGGWLFGANFVAAHGADPARVAAEQVTFGQRACATGVDGASEAPVARAAAHRRPVYAGDRAPDFQRELLLGHFLQLGRHLIASTAAQKNCLRNMQLNHSLTV
jgi:hypothetical protein